MELLAAPGIFTVHVKDKYEFEDGGDCIYKN